MAEFTTPEREEFQRRVSADPDAYEQAIAETVAGFVKGISEVSQLENVRVAGTRPDSWIEVLFRPVRRESCLLGWRWPIWHWDDAPLRIDDAEIEITTPLMEWLDLEGPAFLDGLDCDPNEVTWVKNAPS